MPQKKSTKKAAKKAVKKAAKRSTKKAAKKVTKKTTKKTAKQATKRTARTQASRPLVYATNHESFWVTDGQVLNSLRALRDALAVMDAEVYRFHATGEQNDFVVWVAQVLQDADCAAALEKARTPKTARAVVVRHLKHYTDA